MNYHEDGFYWSHSKFTYDSEEQHTNVWYITRFLRAKGWTDNAIAGVLGNMQSESGINPGAYYGYVEFSAVSFGVVQWDPTSKYQKWHDANYPGVIYEHLGCQLNRLIYEFGNKIQYYSTSEFPISASAFIHSTEPASYLAKVFVRNYERPASVLKSDDETQEEHEAKKAATYAQRGKQGAHWYEFITGNPDPGGGGGGGGGVITPWKGFGIRDLLLYGRRRYHVV